MWRRLRQLDGRCHGAVLQLVDHLNRTRLAECPRTPRQIVQRGLLRDESVSVLIGADKLEVAHRCDGKIFLDGVKDFSDWPLYLLNARNDARRFNSKRG